MAFLTLVWQGPALLGPRGLLPIDSYLADVAAEAGSRASGFWELPSVFWFGASDSALRAAGWIGAALSLAMLAGYTNAVVLVVPLRFADLDLQRRADVLRLRLGAAAGRDRVPLHLSLSAAGAPAISAAAAAARGDLASALAGDADHVGRGAHQAARRFLLARSDLPRLSLRDAAGAEPADAVLSCAAALGARGRRRLQPRRRAGGAVSDPRPAALPLRRRRADAGAAAHPDRQRQPGVSQLADAGADPRLLRRRALAAPSSGGAGGARRGGVIGRASRRAGRG